MKALFQGLKTALNTASDTDTIIYNGISYKCRCSSREMRLNLESVGFQNIKGVTVYIDMNIPLESIIEYNNVKYRVMQVSNYTHDINKLQCEELF